MISLVLHGGAWDIPDELVEPHRRGMHNALRVGWEVLQHGGTAVDAVERAVIVMEDDETFDAGKGSFLNAVGEVEMDASIMSGRTLRAGAVAAVQNVRNPVSLARKIMDEGEHVLLVGQGAVRFAQEHDVPLCRQEDLVTERELCRWRDLQANPNFTTRDAFRRKQPHGTVGAVARDGRGDIAAATSTGGTPNKYPGRVGDSPLIGCGTYADNAVGGVSTTGWGEAMIKVVMAKTVVDLMEVHSREVSRAVRDALQLLERRIEGYGGIIALNCEGHVAVAYNTPRMARAYLTSDMAAPFVGVG